MSVKAIKKALIGAALAFVVSFGISGEPAYAQACSKHKDIVENLKNKYQEKQQGYGLIGGVAIMELFVSDKGTWTIIITQQNGIACIVAAGNDWEQLPEIAGNEV